MEKKKYNTEGDDNNKNTYTYNDNNEDFNDDEIIINTDNDQTEKRKKVKENIINKNNLQNKEKKIKNTIYINNSNVTISNRNNNNNNDIDNNKKDENQINKKKKHKIKNEYNCFNSNEDNIELDELINKVFNEKNNSKVYNTNENKNLLTESEIDKDYFCQLYSEQSQSNINSRDINEKDEKIINKLKEIKDKINNKNKIKKKKIKRYNTDYNSYKTSNISNTMNNKQIKKNIPTYRRHSKPITNSNNVFNSLSLTKNIYNCKKFKFNSVNSVNNGYYSLDNSFNKSFNSLLNKSVKSPFYNTSHLNYNNNKLSRKKNSIGKWSRGTPCRFNSHNSYFNNSSIQNISSGCINSRINAKKNKDKKLYNIVTKNIIKKELKKSNKNNNNNKKTIDNKDKSNNNNLITNTEINDEIKLENSQNLLYHQYRDIIEADLPIVYNSESLINNDLFESNINNKIIINYNKLNNYKTTMILYDGFIYKIIDKNNIGFKASKRYFQITKNCLRYYNEIENAKNNDEPLVQFDIRHIKDLQIINFDFLKDVKIDDKDIKFVFCIYLYQNDDFFVFAVSDDNYGNSIFNVLNLLKNYYEDKK